MHGNVKDSCRDAYLHNVRNVRDLRTHTTAPGSDAGLECDGRIPLRLSAPCCPSLPPRNVLCNWPGGQDCQTPSERWPSHGRHWPLGEPRRMAAVSHASPLPSHSLWIGSRCPRLASRTDRQIGFVRRPRRCAGGRSPPRSPELLAIVGFRVPAQSCTRPPLTQDPVSLQHAPEAFAEMTSESSCQKSLDIRCLLLRLVRPQTCIATAVQ